MTVIVCLSVCPGLRLSN